MILNRSVKMLLKSISTILIFLILYSVKALEMDDELKKFLGTLERYQNNDVVFLLDESGSIGQDNFPPVLLFTELIARIMSISAAKNHPAVVTFSSDNVVHLNYILETENNNMCTFLPKVWNIPYRGGGTYTLGALQLAKDILQMSKRSVNKIVVLISDGQSNGGDPLPAATELKSLGVKIFGIGVADINKAEIINIATSEEYVYFLKDFLKIKELNDKLKDDIRDEWERVNSTLCESFCKFGKECCDVNADCSCGSRSGKHQCACRPGFYGSGAIDDCRPCPKGTYSNSLTNKDCTKCPDNSTTLEEGSKDIKKCFCLRGHEGNPETNIPCQIVQCAKLMLPEGGFTIPPNKCGNTYNSTCTFKCNKGYCPYSCQKTAKFANNINPWDIEPEEPRKCLETKKWSGVEFYCEKIKCPALNYPKHGSHNCSQSDFGYGTICQMNCEEGYILQGSEKRQCQENGKWDGNEVTCKVVLCPILKINEVLKVKPVTCSRQESEFNTVCHYFCKNGFKLVSVKDSTENQDINIRKCLANGTWSRINDQITCKDNTPPVLNCSDDIQVFTDKHKPTAKVEWKSPNASDNVEVKSVKILFPSKLNKQYHSFNIGTNKVTYVATDISGLNTTCSFNIIVKDIEPPRIKSCPDDIIVFHGKMVPGILVNWTEPEFEDNSGKITIVSQNRKSGDEFFWGPPAPVVYKVSDPSGNVAECHFNVIVKQYPCEYVPPPLNGALACDNWLGGQLCKVYCEEGYDFISLPEKEYFCRQLGTHAKWGRFLESPKVKFQSFKFPWPDCGRIIRRRSIKNSIKMPYYSGLCPDEKVKVEIQKKFVQMFEKYPQIMGLCPKETCIYKNVNVTCGNVIGSSLGNLVRKKRNSNNIIQIEFEWDVTLKNNCSDTDNEECEEISLQFTDEEIKKDLQDFQVKSTETLSNYIPFLSPIEDKIEFKRIPNCEVGQIIRNMSCVNCPQGTFFNNNLKECIACPLDTYQDNEGEVSCKKCPVGTSTINKNAKSIEECKSFCSPGTYSKTGLEICEACPIGTYQNLFRQTTCNTCTSDSTTWTIGLSSVENCTTICSWGTYSDTGYHPCTPCPFGTYQPNSQQIECISCPPEHTTRIEGAHLLQYCAVIDLCEELQPCQNFGTCINTENKYTCLCQEGYKGKQCEINIDDCSEDLCLNNGTCIDGINNYSCLCLSGFAGSNCEINVNDCDTDSCLNGGTCIDGINNFICKCPKGFTGKICDINYYDCSSNPCQNGGTCFDQAGDFRCCCPKKYMGKHCEHKIKNCDSIQCLNGGNCIEKINDFECNCREGFSGKYCEINDDDCKDGPCINGGTCVDEISNYTCKCLPSFNGSNCENKIEMSTNFGLKFLSETTTNYVKIYNHQLLYAVTVSFWIRCLNNNENNRGTPISYSYKNAVTEKEVENALTLIDVHKFLFYLHGEKFYTDIDATRDNDWHHCTITWDSWTGDWSLYWDNIRRLNGTGLAVGSVLWNGYFVLGQEQDSIGGAFSVAESFLGEITQFNVWNHVLPNNEIQHIKNTCGLIGNVISWNDCKNNIHGEIVVEENSEFCTKIGICNPDDCYCYGNSSEKNSDCWRSLKTCMPNDCDNNQKCLMKNGFFQCDCDIGFQGKYCQYDIDECLNNNGNCSHFCTNIKGSYICSCPNGMRLNDDKVTCIDTSYCKENKETHLDGEVWLKKCEECKCDEGKITCFKKSCPDLTCMKNETKILLPGKCCDMCISESSCTVQNNTFKTFDNFIFDFSGNCRYTVVDDCIDGEFSIRYEDANVGSKEKIIYVYNFCTEAKILPSGEIFIREEAIKLPYFSDVLHIIQNYEDQTLLVITSQGIKLKWKSSQMFEVEVPHKYRRKVCGFCGNFNGNKNDDFMTKHHLPARTITDSSHTSLKSCQEELITKIFNTTASASATVPTNINEFGLSWKVDGHKYCRITSIKKPKNSKLQVITFNKCKLTSIYRQNKAIKECSILKTINFKKCHKYVNPIPYYKMCLQDSCSCSHNEPCYCDSITAYVLECQHKNISIRHWTIKNKCAFRCGGEMVYDDCGPPCQESCSPTGIDLSCQNEICVPGCYCPAGKVLYDGKCILKTKCPTSWNAYNFLPNV